jgi:hypothetical protein
MVEIRSKGGKLLGKLSDSTDGEDFLIVKNKKVLLSEVYSDKELKDSFNEDVKKSITSLPEKDEE